MLLELDRLQAENGTSRAAFIAIGSYMMLGGQYMDRAGTLLAENLNRHPYYSGFWYLSAVQAFLQGDLKQTESICRRALFIWPHLDEARLLLAKALAAEGDHARALRIYRRMIFLGEGAPEVYFPYAVSLHELGQNDKALEAVQKYLQKIGRYKNPREYREAEALRNELSPSGQGTSN
jgi:tetratricopeptide (TPR) repeat protein